MNLLRVLFTFFVAILLSACATNADRTNEKLATIPEANRAYLVGTFAVECSPLKEACNHAFNALTINYKNLEDKEVKGNLTFTSGSAFGRNTEHDFMKQDRREKGVYFCLALPVGSYAFHTFSFYNFAGGGGGFSIKEEGQFKLPFNLNNGEIVNVGKLKLTTSATTSFLGVSRAAPGNLLISNGSEIDANAALQKCPETVRNKTMRNAFLNIADAKGSPFVQVEK